MKYSFLDFVIKQWSALPPVETADLSGKTVLVVGANVGIGLESSKHFARMQPARLIIACRSEAKGKAALAGMYNRLDRIRCKTIDVYFLKKSNESVDTTDASSG
jgi:NAD(P)-dependent dehydrogenase (short-subunit alcohol dehydrogenase family)